MSFLDELEAEELKSPPLARRPKDIEAYGTSEGVKKEWDERGRGKKGRWSTGGSWLDPDLTGKLPVGTNWKGIRKTPTDKLPEALQDLVSRAVTAGESGTWSYREIPVSELKGLVEEFRDFTKEDNEHIDRLATSMKKDGLQRPFVLGPMGFEGAHRLAAAEKLGWKTIPSIEFDNRKMMAHNDPNIDEKDPAINAKTGTKASGYHKGKYGPCRCDNCIHFEKEQSGCDNTHVLKDSEIADVGKIKKVDAADWCDYFRNKDALVPASANLEAHGTSEGVRKAWDERGRGRKEADD